MNSKLKIGVLLGVSVLTFLIFFIYNLESAQLLNQDGVILQKTKSDCGIAVVQNVLFYFGKSSTSIDSSLADVGIGVTLLEIKQALVQSGLQAKGYKTTANEIQTLSFPMIAHFKKNHFVVLESISENGVVLIDPSIGRVLYSKQKFAEKWDGVVLCVSENK
jgi:ABC-type bacteriocin/lantibiotic exporter with double-glycine peptidase domain